MVTEREMSKMHEGMTNEFKPGRGSRWMRRDTLVCTAWALLIMGAALGGALTSLPV